MNQDEIIRKALTDITLADALMDKAKQSYHRARVQLEGFYSPTAPKRGKHISGPHAANVIAKRTQTILRKKEKAV